MSYELPALPYDKEALAPYMSAETLEYHHGKHHQAYVNKSNDMIQGTGLEGKPDEDIMKAAFNDPKLSGLFNNFAQYWNHKHFWNWMKPNGGGNKLPGSLESKISEAFGGYDGFRDKFIAEGGAQFGSGWVWLASDDSGALSIMKTPNGENPVVHGKHALLGCDVWEHSYYIDYRNARPKYLEAFVDNLINWEYVEELYKKIS